MKELRGQKSLTIHDVHTADFKAIFGKTRKRSIHSRFHRQYRSDRETGGSYGCTSYRQRTPAGVQRRRGQLPHIIDHGMVLLPYQVPPTLTIRPSRPISHLRFTLTASPLEVRPRVRFFPAQYAPAVVGRGGQGSTVTPDTCPLGIVSHLGILSPIPCRMTGVTLPHPTRDRG